MRTSKEIIFDYENYIIEATCTINKDSDDTGVVYFVEDVEYVATTEDGTEVLLDEFDNDSVLDLVYNKFERKLGN